MPIAAPPSLPHPLFPFPSPAIPSMATAASLSFLSPTATTKTTTTRKERGGAEIGWACSVVGCPLPPSNLYFLTEREYRDRTSSSLLPVLTLRVVAATLFHPGTWPRRRCTTSVSLGDPGPPLRGQSIPCPIAMGTTSQFSDAANDPSHLVATGRGPLHCAALRRRLSRSRL